MPGKSLERRTSGNSATAPSGKRSETEGDAVMPYKRTTSGEIVEVKPGEALKKGETSVRLITNLALGEPEVEDADEDVEGDIDPEHAEGAFLMRAETAAKLAVYSRGPITADVVRYARWAATSWSKLADNLEKDMRLREP